MAQKLLKTFTHLTIFLIFFPNLALASENFKFHLNSEPKSLDPAEVSFGDGVGYFYQNIYQGLYLYKRKGLVPLGAKSCKFQKLTLTCKLNTHFKWSDGKTVEASEYVLAFRHLISHKSKSTVIRILKNIKNAGRIFAGELADKDLGVKALNPHILQFKFEKEDPEFLYKLASPLVAPIRNEKFPAENEASKLVVTGPFQIESWTVGKRILLTENPNYLFFKKNKPKVEIFFVDDDQTALLLYEAHKINFLKMLPTTLVSEFSSRPDFLEVPMARFDYIGFSPELRTLPKLREALALSLDYSELKKMFSSVGMPGCSSLPNSYMSESVCVSFDLDKSKKIFLGLPKNVRNKRLHLAFSSYARDDVLRAMQWAAEQWKQHLGVKVELEKLESGVFTARLKDAVPDLFRKSVIIDRPTCLAAIENFGNQGSEGFLKLGSATMDKIILQMSQPHDDKLKQKLCSAALHELISSFSLIGLGQMHFTMLASPKFIGWEINELNGLDLSQLQFDPQRPE